MPSRPCPACQQDTARLLEGASAGAYVWYYICPQCGHTWSVSKIDETNIRHVTPLPSKAELPR